MRENQAETTNMGRGENVSFIVSPSKRRGMNAAWSAVR